MLGQNDHTICVWVSEWVYIGTYTQQHTCLYVCDSIHDTFYGMCVKYSLSACHADVFFMYVRVCVWCWSEKQREEQIRENGWNAKEQQRPNDVRIIFCSILLLPVCSFSFSRCIGMVSDVCDQLTRYSISMLVDTFFSSVVYACECVCVSRAYVRM